MQDQIESIWVEEFQSHRETELKLHPGVNAVVGLSDCGKSAIFRALIWVLENQPKGEAFRRTGGRGLTGVDFHFRDGISVTRERSKTVNQYAIGEEDYKAVGQGGPPEAVVEALRMGPINYQSQMDTPFLLAASPSEVAKTLNKIVHLDVIDRAVSNIRKRVLAVGRDLSAKQNRETELEADLKAFDDLEAREADLQLVEEVERIIQRGRSDIRDLAETIDSAKQNQAQLTECEEFLEIEADALPLFDLIQEMADVRLDMTDLARLISSIGANQAQGDDWRRRVEKMEAELADALSDECPLCGRTE